LVDPLTIRHTKKSIKKERNLECVFESIVHVHVINLQDFMKRKSYCMGLIFCLWFPYVNLLIFSKYHIFVT
jgi:hypothetical protein